MLELFKINFEKPVCCLQPMKILVIYLINIGDGFPFIFSKHKSFICSMNREYFIKRYTRNINQNPFSTSSARNFLIFDIWIAFLPISIIGFTIYKAFPISFSIFTTRLYFFY